jgi:hypothetical protein
MKLQHGEPTVPGMQACYLIGILGYALGMALSLAGYVPAGLAVVSAAAVFALALFRSEARAGDPDGLYCLKP